MAIRDPVNFRDVTRPAPEVLIVNETDPRGLWLVDTYSTDYYREDQYSLSFYNEPSGITVICEYVIEELGDLVHMMKRMDINVYGFATRTSDWGITLQIYIGATRTREEVGLNFMPIRAAYLEKGVQIDTVPDEIRLIEYNRYLS